MAKKRFALPKAVGNRRFKKTANRTNVKNISSKTMMRGGFHF